MKKTRLNIVYDLPLKKIELPPNISNMTGGNMTGGNMTIIDSISDGGGDSDDDGEDEDNEGENEGGEGNN